VREKVTLMIPRQRVLAAVRGEEVWPVPTDVFENGLHPRIRAGLQDHYHLDHEDFEALLRALGAEFRWAGARYVGPPLEEAPFEAEAQYPFAKIRRSMWGTWAGIETYSETFERPLSAVETVAEVDAYRWPDPDWLDFENIGWQGKVLTMAEWADQAADYARIVGGWNPVFCRVMELYGMDTGLLNLALRPDLIHATIARIGEYLEVYYQRLAASASGHADFLGFGDDFAGQQGMLLSPDQWREYFLPLWKRLFAIAHHHNLIPLMHMCGSVRPVLGDLIDAGLEVCEVMQITARGMDPAELKREFGQHLTFYGGIDTQHTLPFGTANDVRREVQERIDVMAKGGRYILSSIHFLTDNIPVQNVVAMVDEARTYQASWHRKGQP
jgi:uroporphyrinogen decarboxylase